MSKHVKLLRRVVIGMPDLEEPGDVFVYIVPEGAVLPVVEDPYYTVPDGYTVVAVDTQHPEHGLRHVLVETSQLLDWVVAR